jgi:hypothetical protein
MIRLIDNNLDLYRPDKNNYLNSLEYARSLNTKTSKPLIFHCFWRVPREFGKKQFTVLKSIIANHKKAEITLWSNVDLRENEYFKKISPAVNFKLWDLNEEIKNTILEGEINKEDIQDDLCYLEGDLFRLLILYKYGGFYIDMDVLVLRDMSPLNELEFLYQWGTSGFNPNEPSITMNGAIMRLDKESPVSLELLEKLLTSPKNKNTNIWGNHLYSRVSENNLTVLPCIWFDSEWGFEETIHNPFKKADDINLFEGAFAWHWHNRWDSEIEDGSKFDILDKIIEQKFKNI